MAPRHAPSLQSHGVKSTGLSLSLLIGNTRQLVVILLLLLAILALRASPPRIRQRVRRSLPFTSQARSSSSPSPSSEQSSASIANLPGDSSQSSEGAFTRRDDLANERDDNDKNEDEDGDGDSDSATTTVRTETTTKAKRRAGKASKIVALNEVERTGVFTHGGQIPVGAELRYAHMASAVVLSRNKTWLVAFQASKYYEGADDQRIYTVTSEGDDVNGTTWNLPVEAIPAKAAQWSPVLWQEPRHNTIMLFYTQSHDETCMRPADGKKPPLWAPGGDIMVADLERDGTFGMPRRLLAQSEARHAMGSPKVIANPPIVVGKRWILPFWRETRTWAEECQRHADSESAGVLISDNMGQSWQARGHVSTRGTHLIEGTLSSDDSGRLHQFFRTSLGRVHESASTDQGISWGTPVECPMNNADAKMQLHVHPPTGTLLAVFNDHGPKPSDVRGHEGCRKCRTRLQISAAISPAHPCDSLWRPLAKVSFHHTTYLRAHYPHLVSHRDHLYVFYSTLYACCAPANATLGIWMVKYNVDEA